MFFLDATDIYFENLIKKMHNHKKCNTPKRLRDIRSDETKPELWRPLSELFQNESNENYKKEQNNAPEMVSDNSVDANETEIFACNVLDIIWDSDIEFLDELEAQFGDHLMP